MQQKIKIAYIINHLSFFCSHILPLAEEARKRGFIIHIFCGIGGSKKMEKKAIKIIKKKKIGYSRLNFKPGAENLIIELYHILKLIFKVKNFKPDIVHGISIKGIINSSLYSFFLKPKKLILFITGMGYFFTNRLNFFEKILKLLILKIIKLSLNFNKSILVLENNDDLNFFVKKHKIKRKKILKIPGVGVDLKKYNYIEKNKKNIVLFPARVLKEKGIQEFYMAAEKLTLKFKNWLFLIAGTLDYEKNNRNNLKINFNNKKKIKFLGYVEKMYNLFNKASIVCLPSYREGFPKSLIEASSSGCAIVTTNVPGCREVVKKNTNAFLVKPKDHNALYKNLKKLISNKKLRKKFSNNSRNIANKKYDVKKFVGINIKEYQNI